MKSVIKRSAIAALSVGVVAGLTLGAAPAANAAGDDIVFIQGVKGDGFYITMDCGVKAAAKKAGVKVKTVGGAKWDVALQKPILDSIVAGKPGAILIAPNDVKAMQRPLENAAKKGIEIILVDTTVKKPKFAASAISSNNFAGGKEAYNAVKRLVPGGGKVMGISTMPGISTTDARDAGFKSAVGKSGGLFNYIGLEYSNNEPSKAAQITTAAIAANPDLKAIFASNLFSAQGAATGIKQAGKEGKIIVIGFDAGPDQVKALKAGTVQALIAQSPYDIGTKGVQQAVKAMAGKKTKKKMTTGFTILTAGNINTKAGKKAQYLSKC